MKVFVVSAKTWNMEVGEEDSKIFGVYGLEMFATAKRQELRDNPTPDDDEGHIVIMTDSIEIEEFEVQS